MQNCFRAKFSLSFSLSSSSVWSSSVSCSISVHVTNSCLVIIILCLSHCSIFSQYVNSFYYVWVIIRNHQHNFLSTYFPFRQKIIQTFSNGSTGAWKRKLSNGQNGMLMLTRVAQCIKVTSRHHKEWASGFFDESSAMHELPVFNNSHLIFIPIKTFSFL